MTVPMPDRSVVIVPALEEGAQQPNGVLHVPCDGRPNFWGAELDTLFREHWSDLVGWIRKRFGKGPPSPEDIAQEAFAKLAAHVRPESIVHAKSYLYSIAANAALDELHWMKRTDAYIQRELCEIGLVVDEVTPARICESRQALGRIEVALGALNDKQREIVWQSRFLGKTYAEISEETGWSVADISRQLNTALVRLKSVRDGVRPAIVPAPRTGMSGK
ncbi:MAG: sigma-70 family RNA polymerase sigma factor [Novosphingobium sp.]